ncbi:MAG: hypothetical protein WA432_03435 [Candidatus Babeliaceae bacterium]
MAELMTIADIFITKTGTTSLFEALQMNLPVFLHTKKFIKAESENIEFVKRYKIGVCIDNVKQVNQILTEYLAEQEKLEIIKNAINSLAKYDFFDYLKSWMKEH